MRTFFITIIVILVFQTSHLSAQIYTPPFNINHRIYVNTYEQQEANKNPKKVKDIAKSEIVAPPTKDFLVYKSTATQRKLSYQRFVDQQRQFDAQGAEGTKELFKNTDVINEIGKVMETIGLKPTNVADSYTVWLISAWEAVNNKDMKGDKVIYQAVKKQAVQIVGDNDLIYSASDAEKQEVSELMLLQAALIDAAKEESVGNSAKQMELAKAVNTGALKVGFDLKKMSLSQKGFSYNK